MAAIARVNGRILSERDATISVFDYGFLFGDGVYEVVRTYHHLPFLLDRHLVRLRNSATMIALEIPTSDAGLSSEVTETVEAYLAGPGREKPERDMYIRMLVTRGIGDGTYNPASSPRPSVVILVKPLNPPPPSAYQDGVSVTMASIMRNHPASVSPLIKSNNLLNNVLAMQEAIKRQAFEAVLRNYRGELAECSQSNLFVVAGGRVRTPRLDAGLLGGITRGFLFDVAEEAGVPLESAVLRDEDLFAADEAFLTSTTREVVPIVRVDTRVIADGRPGPVTRRLLDAYRQQADRAILADTPGMAPA